VPTSALRFLLMYFCVAAGFSLALFVLFKVFLSRPKQAGFSSAQFVVRACVVDRRFKLLSEGTVAPCSLTFGR